MEIRRCSLEDASNFLEMLIQLDKETKYMLFEPGERNTNINSIKSMISQSIDNDNLLLVALENSNIIGFLLAQKNCLKKIKHTASIVIGIRKSFCQKGLGSKLFLELDNWAVNNSILRLELTVMKHNVIAQNLYKKNGFEIEGTKRRSIFMDGKYIDEYYMSKIYFK